MRVLFFVALIPVFLMSAYAASYHEKAAMESKISQRIRKLNESVNFCKLSIFVTIYRTSSW